MSHNTFRDANSVNGVTLLH